MLKLIRIVRSGQLILLFQILRNNDNSLIVLRCSTYNIFNWDNNRWIITIVIWHQVAPLVRKKPEKIMLDIFRKITGFRSTWRPYCQCVFEMRQHQSNVRYYKCNLISSCVLQYKIISSNWFFKLWHVNYIS